MHWAFDGYNFLLARENLTDHLPLNQRNNKTRHRLLKIRANKVITATGSLERPLIFDNNDRPGIMLSSAVEKYANLFGVSCGEKNVLFTNNDSAYETAISLFQKGKKPILISHLKSIINVIDELKIEYIKKLRDKTIILLGFGGGFRRTELISR